LSQNLLFVLKEGFGGLRRSRFAGVVATITVAISLILIGVFLIITVNLGRVVDTLRNRVELEVFLDDAMDDAAIQALAEEIKQISGVKEITFISKEMAILEYKRLFKDTEDDYFRVLGYNPLPASFRVKLLDDFRTPDGAESVYRNIAALEGVDEDSVVYRREFLVLLEKYIRVAIAIDFIVGSIICLSALLLVSNNIRLIISAKQKMIETMKLVGATNFFVRAPLYIQGTVQGFMGGVLASSFLYGLLRLAELEIPGFLVVDWRIYMLLAILGVLLGFAGSFTAVRKYL